MSKLDDLVDRYKAILDKMTDAEIQAFIDRIVFNDWDELFSVIASKMATSELLEELDRVNESLSTLNAQNAEYIEVQREIVKQLLLTGLMLSKRAVS